MKNTNLGRVMAGSIAAVAMTLATPLLATIVDVTYNVSDVGAYTTAHGDVISLTGVANTVLHLTPGVAVPELINTVNWSTSGTVLSGVETFNFSPTISVASATPPSRTVNDFSVVVGPIPVPPFMTLEESLGIYPLGGTLSFVLANGMTLKITPENFGTLQGPGQSSHNGMYAQFLVVPVPEAPTLIAGALLLLPLGMSTLRILRRHSMA